MEIDLANTFCAANIRYLRKRYGLSRRALCRLSGIQATALRRIEADAPAVLTTVQVHRLCAIFGLPAETLFHEDLTGSPQ